jgi:hypothetical protein
LAAVSLTAALLAAALLAAALLAAVPANAAVLASATQPSASLLDELQATLGALDTMSHNVTMKTSNSLTRGTVDPVAGTSAIVVTQDTSEFDETVSGGSIWVKLDIDPATNRQLGVSPDTWMELDLGKLAPSNTLPIPADGSDPMDMAGIFAGVTDVAAVDSRHFVGTIDLGQVAGRNTPDPEEVRQAGAAANAAPFRVTADTKGRITEFLIDASAFDPNLSIDVTYGDYGVAKPVSTPPTAIPAPDDLYDLFVS